MGKDRVNIGGREQANIDSAFAKLNSDHYFDKKNISNSFAQLPASLQKCRLQGCVCLLIRLRTST